MESTHYASDLDPSSVLGFGSALSMLDSAEEVGRLLTGALRSMGLADVQAVVLTRPQSGDTTVVGSVGTEPLPDPIVDELRELRAELSLETADAQSAVPRPVDVQSETHPALAGRGIERLTIVRLGTIDHDFGIAVAGQKRETSHTPMQRASLQMMAAQVSMALHRIQLNREQQAKEEALRKSEVRYRTLYESAPVAYVSVTGTGEIHMANERAADLMSTTENDLMGRTITSFCADTSEATRTAEQLTDCIQRGSRLFDKEVEICRADGEQIWVSMSVQPIETSTEGAECLVMMTDITERVRMETALREARADLEERVDERTAELKEANERLQTQAERLGALRNIDQAILEAESSEEIAVEAIQRARRILPFERASVTVLDWEEEEAHVLATSQRDTLDSGTTIPFDRFYLSDELRAGRTELIPDLNDATVPEAARRIREMGVRSVLCLPMVVEGEVMGVVHVGRTEPNAFAEGDWNFGRELADHLAVALRQARLLEEVQAQREELATLQDIDQAILAAESPEEIAAEAIQGARKIIPFESASVTVIDQERQTAHVLAACENNVLEPPTTLPLDQVYLSEDLLAGTTEVISDHDYEPVPEAAERIREMGLRSVLCLPMLVEDEVIGVVHVGRTGTDAFSASDREVGRELADRLAIALRQARLLEQVQEQRQRLEERVKERTQELESFTYSVSHDLRTPLRAIDGYTRILREDHADQLDDDGQRLLDVVHESAQTMSDLIDDLLTLSRLGRREMNHVDIDMEALAREAYDELRRTQPDTAEQVTFERQSLPPAKGDRSMIRHVYTNLFSNALKFTRQEEVPRLEVDGERRDGTHVYAVRDNGVGFDENDADKMFGVFERLHGDSPFEGTGVGLALVERIVRRHGGEVWAEGAEGEGATIFFTLPTSAPRTEAG